MSLSPQPGGPVRWSVAAPGSLYWRQLDDDWVVHCDATGATHCLDMPAATLMQRLLSADRPLSAAELATQLAEDLVPTQDEVAGVAAALALLAQSGLLRQH